MPWSELTSSESSCIVWPEPMKTNRAYFFPLMLTSSRASSLIPSPSKSARTSWNWCGSAALHLYSIDSSSADVGTRQPFGIFCSANALFAPNELNNRNVIIADRISAQRRAKGRAKMTDQKTPCASSASRLSVKLADFTEGQKWAIKMTNKGAGLDASPGAMQTAMRKDCDALVNAGLLKKSINNSGDKYGMYIKAANV